MNATSLMIIVDNTLQKLLLELQSDSDFFVD